MDLKQKIAADWSLGIHYCSCTPRMVIMYENFTCRFFLYFSIAGKVNQHYVLNVKADEFVPRFSTTSGIGTEKFAKQERGYVLYFISIGHFGRYSFMRANEILFYKDVFV